MTSLRFRKGTAADRGKILRWPAEPVSVAGHPITLRSVVPGIVTGAANVDPSLVVTATVAGAAFGYSLLWVVVL